MSVVKEKRYNGWLIGPSPWPGRHIRQLLKKVPPDMCALPPVLSTEETVQHIVRQLWIQHVHMCMHAHARHTHTRARAHPRTHTAHMHMLYRASHQIEIFKRFAHRDSLDSHHHCIVRSAKGPRRHRNSAHQDDTSVVDHLLSH